MFREQGWDAVRYDPIYHPDTAYTHQHFDLIVSTEVFEHLDDPVGVMSHLHGCLAPGGYLALQTQFYPEDTGEFLQWYYRLDPTHIGFFAPQTFRWLASKYGMEYVTDDGRNKVLLRR
jgi:SAM-dependent methyltransferase